MSDDRMRENSVPCPVCKAQTAWRDNPFRPFCSERCRVIDLGKWAAGEYCLAGETRPRPVIGADGDPFPEK